MCSNRNNPRINLTCKTNERKAFFSSLFNTITSKPHLSYMYVNRCLWSNLYGCMSKFQTLTLFIAKALNKISFVIIHTYLNNMNVLQIYSLYIRIQELRIITIMYTNKKKNNNKKPNKKHLSPYVARWAKTCQTQYDSLRHLGHYFEYRHISKNF